MNNQMSVQLNKGDNLLVQVKGFPDINVFSTSSGIEINTHNNSSRLLITPTTRYGSASTSPASQQGGADWNIGRRTRRRRSVVGRPVQRRTRTPRGAGVAQMAQPVRRRTRRARTVAIPQTQAA